LSISLLSAALRYALFAVLAVIGPGIGAQRLARVRTDPALVLPIGVALASAAYSGGRWAAFPWLFPLIVLLLDAAALFEVRGSRAARGPSLPGALPPVLVLVGLFWLTQYRSNRFDDAGDFRLDPLVTWDTALHVGLARELALETPPQVPMLAGVPLSYHYGADLVRAAALRWAGVDPYDSISRFELTLYALALALLLRGLAARLAAPPLAVWLAPLALLATDFSFLFGGMPKARWWADEFRGNLLLSLVLGNPVIPALALALGALVAVARYEAGEGRGYLALAALQAAAAPFFKAFTGAHLALALGLAAVAAPPGRRRGIATLAAAPLLACALLASSAAGQRVTVALDPLDLVRATRAGLGLPPASGAVMALFAPVWLAVSLGLRSLGIRPACEAALSRGAAAVASAALALTAWPLALLVRVSADAAPGDPVINNANFFAEQGGVLLWLFTAVTLARIAGRRRVPVLAAAALLALPSTLQFAVKKAGLASDRVDAEIVAAMHALERASLPGDVVLQRPASAIPPPPVILAGRRVPFERFSPFLGQFAPPSFLEERHEAVLRFFRATDPSEAHAAARALDAGFVCLYGEERVRFDARALLEPLFESPEARCYKIVS
jgi:hypothetical protein